MSVVCITDEIVERQLERWPLARLLVRAIAEDLRKERSRRSGQLEQAPSATQESPRHGGLVWARDERIEFLPRAQSRFTIRLGHNGSEAIKREISWAASEGVEMGGFLWAHLPTDAQGGQVMVAHVSPPAADSLHGRTSVRLGNPEGVARAWPDWLSRSGLIAVGDVHSHPSGDGTPSRSDQENWPWGVRQSGGSPWVSLIATRGEDGLGWSAPRFAGWVTSPDGHGGFILSPGGKFKPGMDARYESDLILRALDQPAPKALVQFTQAEAIKQLAKFPQWKGHLDRKKALLVATAKKAEAKGAKS